ncbi:hypothetical protein NGM10_07745 [Halorussus salilacus]|uniref:hypothetical protein n=1 Tax=Halorussus salilacus TaxID=2953750 RepID=UPI00209E8C34|nr:hypothetical protein [Halorussus salilacus]USZ69612.1 hypothetical protein NGM10_07745 [Halorussus salilacus]
MVEREKSWTVLGLGGAASLCCLGSALVGGAAVGGAALTTGAVAGGLGAGLAQVLVTILTVGALGLAWRVFGGGASGDGGRACRRR